MFMKTIILLLVVVALTSACTQIQERGTDSITESDQPSTYPQESTPYGSRGYQPRNCNGTGTIDFTSPIMRLEEIGYILPLGLINANSGHVTPTDHGYYFPPDWKPSEIEDSRKFKDILAPADGIITEISLVGGRLGDYRMIIHHTCTFYTIYIHIRELPQKILQVTGDITTHTTPNIQVKAGEIIGRSNGFDFSVNNDDVTLTGFIVPEHYNNAEPWKIHTVDMFAYFVEPLRSQLLAKNVRQAEPRTGKIDYDIDGRLVGNWFVENTNGYRGLQGNWKEGYWVTHLSFVYDGIDPSLIVVSVGNFSGKSAEFAVKGNNPDPADISVDGGLVKYELVSINYVTDEGKNWDRISFAKVTKALGDNYVMGIALVQMVENRKIRFEVFPGKTAAEVNGFLNPIAYER